MTPTKLLPLLGALLLTPAVQAAPVVVPNPGGSVVTTNSTTSSSIIYVDTSVTQRVDNYSTTLVALLNGNQVFSQTLGVPFSDPTVQAAVAQADAILSTDGASFGAATLFSSTSTLQSSVTTPAPTYSCLAVENGAVPGASETTGVNAVTTTDTFGPATIMVGECQSDIFNILPGQLDINVNTDIQYSVAVNVVTTNTYLDTQIYEITGVTGAAAAPEPVSAALALLGLASVMWGCRRRFGISRP